VPQPACRVARRLRRATCCRPALSRRPCFLHAAQLSVLEQQNARLKARTHTLEAALASSEAALAAVAQVLGQQQQPAGAPEAGAGGLQAAAQQLQAAAPHGPLSSTGLQALLRAPAASCCCSSSSSEGGATSGGPGAAPSFLQQLLEHSGGGGGGGRPGTLPQALSTSASAVAAGASEAASGALPLLNHQELRAYYKGAVSALARLLLAHDAAAPEGAPRAGLLLPASRPAAGRALAAHTSHPAPARSPPPRRRARAVPASDGGHLRAPGRYVAAHLLRQLQRVHPAGRHQHGQRAAGAAAAGALGARGGAPGLEPLPACLPACLCPAGATAGPRGVLGLARWHAGPARGGTLPLHGTCNASRGAVARTALFTPTPAPRSARWRWTPRSCTTWRPATRSSRQRWAPKAGAALGGPRLRQLQDPDSGCAAAAAAAAAPAPMLQVDRLVRERAQLVAQLQAASCSGQVAGAAAEGPAAAAAAAAAAGPAGEDGGAHPEALVQGLERCLRAEASLETVMGMCSIMLLPIATVCRAEVHCWPYAPNIQDILRAMHRLYQQRQAQQ
jgi:hypothetical protein